MDVNLTVATQAAETSNASSSTNSSLNIITSNFLMADAEECSESSIQSSDFDSDNESMHSLGDLEGPPKKKTCDGLKLNLSTGEVIYENQDTISRKQIDSKKKSSDDTPVSEHQEDLNEFAAAVYHHVKRFQALEKENETYLEVVDSEESENECTPCRIATPVCETLEDLLDSTMTSCHSPSINNSEEVDYSVHYKKNELNPDTGDIPLRKRKHDAGYYFRHDEDILDLTFESIEMKLKETEKVNFLAPDNPDDAIGLDVYPLIPEEINRYHEVLTTRPTLTLISNYRNYCTVSTEDCNPIDDVLCLPCSPVVQDGESSLSEVSVQENKEKDESGTMVNNKSFVPCLTEKNNEPVSLPTNNVVLLNNINDDNSQQLVSDSDINVIEVLDINTDPHERITKAFTLSLPEIVCEHKLTNLSTTVDDCKCRNIFSNNESIQSNKLTAPIEMSESSSSGVQKDFSAVSLQIKEPHCSEKDEHPPAALSLSSVTIPILPKLDLNISELRKISKTVNFLPTLECSEPPSNLLNFQESYQYDHADYSPVSSQHVVDYGHGISSHDRTLKRKHYGAEYSYYDGEPLIKIPVVRDYAHKSVKDLDDGTLEPLGEGTIPTTTEARHGVSNDTPPCSKPDLVPDSEDDTFDNDSEYPIESSNEQDSKESEQNLDVKREPSEKPHNKFRFQRVMGRVSSKKFSSNTAFSSPSEFSNFFITPEPLISSDLHINLPVTHSRKACLPRIPPLLPKPDVRPEIPLTGRRTLLPTPPIKKIATDNRAWISSSVHPQNYSDPLINIPGLYYESEASLLPMNSPSISGAPVYFNPDNLILTAQSSVVSIANRGSRRHSRPRQSKCVYLPPKSLKASIGNSLFDTSNVLLLILEWNVDWLDQQQRNHDPPPISTCLRKVVNTYEDSDEYYNTYLPLMLLETWQRMYLSWTHLHQLASPYFCEITSYFVETHSIKVQCQAVFKSSDAERGLFPEEGNIIMVKFGTKDKGGIKIMGFIREVKVRPFDANNDSASASYKVLKSTIGESLQMLTLTFSGAYSSDEFDIKQLIRIQILCDIKSTLKQNDALLNLKNSPLFRNILNPMSDGLRMVTLVPRTADKSNVSECVRDIITGILSPHPFPLLTIAKSSPASESCYIIIPPLVEMMKKFYKTKVLLCTRTKQALNNIGCSLCNGTVKLIIIGKKSDIHHKLRNHLLEEVASKKLTEKLTEDSPISEEKRNDLLTNTKLDILKNCDVILSLIRNCHNDLVAQAYADGDSIAQMCCIIDEANLCSETETLIPLLYGISKLILIGDPEVPSKICSKAASNFDYNRSLFHRAYELDELDVAS